MGNELAKALKKKTDAQFRTMSGDQTPSISEGVGGVVNIIDPSAYTSPIVAGDNINIQTSGNNKVISALTKVVNTNTGAEIKFWVGTEQEYLLLPSVDPNTIYFRSM